LAKDALAFHPPLGFFNRLQSEHGKVDLKKGGIAPIVALARVAALAAGSRQRSTLERLAVAAASGAVINRESARLLAEIFPALLQLRLREQLNNHRANRSIDNSVLLTELSPLERGHLKEAFGVIKQIQDELRATWQLDRLA
jgi:CBS domain-containing protein